MPAIKKEKVEKSDKKSVIKGLWFLFNVGWYVALSIVLPIALGLWLDAPERLNSRPLCTLIGFILGTSLAGYGLYRMLKKFLADEMKNGTNNEKVKEQDSG